MRVSLRFEKMLTEMRAIGDNSSKCDEELLAELKQSLLTIASFYQSSVNT